MKIDKIEIEFIERCRKNSSSNPVYSYMRLRELKPNKIHSKPIIQTCVPIKFNTKYWLEIFGYTK